MKTVPPLLAPAIALAAGIATVAISGGGKMLPLIPAAVSILLYLSRQRAAAIVMLWMTGGMITALLHIPHRLPTSLSGQSIEYAGIIDEVKPTEGGTNLFVSVDSCNGHPLTPFRAHVFVPQATAGLNPCHRVAFHGRLTLFDPYSPDIPDETYLSERLIARGISCSGIVPPDSISEGAPIHSIKAFFYNLGNDFRQRIAWMPVSDRTASFFIATLTADDSFLTDESRRRFSLTGTAHVLALSGMHVAIITSLLFILLTPLCLTRYAKLRWPVVIAALWFFALLTGMPASVVRAVIMATLLGLGAMLERRPYPLNSLCAAAIIILLFAPFRLFAIGFQLSFLAVGGILIFARVINPIRPAEGQPPFISQTVCVTIAATLTTAPLCAYVFHTFPVYFLFTNLLLLAALPLLMYGAIFLIFLNFIGITGVTLGNGLDMIFDILTHILDIVTKLPGGSLTHVNISILSVIICYVAIAFLGVALHIPYRRPFAFTSSCIFAILAVIISLPLSKPSPAIEIYLPQLKSETLLLVRHDRTFAAISSLPTHLTSAKDIADMRWSEFMLCRHIDSLTVIPHRFQSAALSRCDNITRTPRHTFMLVASDADTIYCPRHTDYLVVCKGFTGSIMTLVESIRPDTVILSHDLHPRRARRYATDLTENTIPYLLPPVTIIE